MSGFSGDNDLSINISTNADNKGIEEATNSLSKLEESGNKTGKTFNGFAESFGNNMKKVSVATGVVGAGLTLYAKSATSYLTGLVKDTKALATQTGMTIEESSQMTAAFSRLGVTSQQTSVAFRKLAQDIASSRSESAANALTQEDLRNKMRDVGTQHDDLTNKLKSNEIEVSKLTAEIKKNGDKSGELQNKVESLKIESKSYTNQLSDLTLKTKQYQLKIEETSGPLQKLNVATQNANGTNRSFNDILLDVADRFKTMPNGVDKTTTAVELFGRQGVNMIKVLNLGSQGIKDLEEKAKSLGLTLTQDNIVAVNKYIQSQKDLTESSNALKIQVGTLTAPIMTEFNLKLNEMLSTLINTKGPLGEVTTGVLAFGGPILGAASGVAAFAGNMVSAWPAIIKFTAFVRESTIAVAILEATASTGILLPVAGAIAGLAALTAAAWETKGVLDKLEKKWNDLKAQKIALPNSQLQVSGGSDVGIYAQLRRAFGFASGGYTGKGGINEVAGVVHKGEYVIPQSGVDQSTGLPKDANGSRMVNHYHYGDVYLGDRTAVAAWFEETDRDNLLINKGLSPARGMS